jgi:hypothetical protein
MFEPYLTWATALKRAQHQVSALVLLRGGASAASTMSKPRDVTSQRPKPLPPTPFGLANVASGRRACQAISRSRRAATLLYEATRTTTRQRHCSAAMPCYTRVRAGRCGGDPSMACKGSGVQIPSAPPPHKRRSTGLSAVDRRGSRRSRSRCAAANARPMRSSSAAVTRPPSLGCPPVDPPHRAAAGGAVAAAAGVAHEFVDHP